MREDIPQILTPSRLGRVNAGELHMQLNPYANVHSRIHSQVHTVHHHHHYGNVHTAWSIVWSKVRVSLYHIFVVANQIHLIVYHQVLTIPRCTICKLVLRDVDMDYRFLFGNLSSPENSLR